MMRIKILSCVLLVVFLASLPAAQALAAGGSAVLGSGTILGISVVTDPVTKITTVNVTLSDGSGQAQQAQIGLDTALSLGLVIETANTAMVGQSVSIPNTDPANPTFILTGIVNNLVIGTDPVTNAPALTMTLTDAANVVHTVILSVPDAAALGLITYAPDLAKIGTTMVIDPTKILGSTTYSQKVTTLASYFGPELGVTFDQLAAYEKAGFGYGVIAQACWLAADLGGTSATLDQILAAKKSGDFSQVVLPNGTTAKNWGQLRKFALSDPHHNLGGIVSGKEPPLVVPNPAVINTTTANSNGNGNGKGSVNQGGNGKGHGKGTNK